MGPNHVDVKFIIQDYSVEKNTITLKPYSDNYLYDLSAYDSFNVPYSDIDQTSDIATQLAILCEPIVLSTLKNENFDFGTTEVEQTTAAPLKDYIIIPQYNIVIDKTPENVKAVNTYLSPVESNDKINFIN